MAWLKLDDGFTKHPKFAGWTVAQKWAWLETLEYCARYSTGGRIPDDPQILPRSVTNALLSKAESVGLVDRADDGTRVVHDWLIYNGTTVAEKVAYYLAQHPDASANAVHKALGGTRELVLSEVTRQRRPGSETGTGEPAIEPDTNRYRNGTDEPEPEPAQGGSESGSETGTHAREPVPSPKNYSTKAVELEDPREPSLHDDTDPEPDTHPSSNGTALAENVKTLEPHLRTIA